jgi:hypothetical protein
MGRLPKAVREFEAAEEAREMAPREHSNSLIDSGVDHRNHEQRGARYSANHVETPAFVLFVLQ